MNDKYAIIDILTMDFMKNEEGFIKLYDTPDDASTVCGMYEFDDVWVVKLIYNHRERK